jgi:D-3-phosphoglycerate dehydrogenase
VTPEVVEGELWEQLNSAAEVTVRLPTSEAEMRELLKDVDAIMLGDDPLTGPMIEMASNLKIIARIGIGYNNVDLDVATRKGILVTNVPNALSETVAEHAILLILAVARRLVTADEYVRSNRWNEFCQASPGFDLAGKTLGIIGFGAIGSAVARRMQCFNMKLLGFDPYIADSKIAQFGGRLVTLEELLKESDVVTIHTPLTSETKLLIGRRELGMMKRSAILINTARGSVIDEQSLVDALRNKKIAAAGLDVLTIEPPESGNPLLRLENVILSPHSAAFTLEAYKRLWAACANAVLNVLHGELPANIVNSDVIRSLNVKRN